MITRCSSCGCEDVEAVELGPDLPPLIYASDGTVWGRYGGGAVWWYGSHKLVTWGQLVAMRAGQAPRWKWDMRPDGFPWGPWVGANYGADHQAILEQLGVPA